MLDLGTLKIGLKLDKTQAEKATDEFTKKSEKSADEVEKAWKKSSKATEQNAESAMTNITKNVASGVKKIIATVATVETVKLAVSGLKSIISEYADYQQLAGGVETLFKDSADQVKQYADEAYKTAGLSANEYMDTVTSFSASLISSLGGDTEKASELANQAIIDMSDNANKMGTDMAQIQSAYQGFAKQNYTMLDNLKLGYGGTKTEMERLLKDASKLSGVAYSMESYADIIQAIHVIQTEMDITGTTQLEASETISGSINMTKAAWSNFVASFGKGKKDVQKSTKALVDSFKDVIKNVVPIAKEVISAIWDEFQNVEFGDLINEIFGTDIDLGFLNRIDDIVSSIIETLKSVYSIISPWLPVVSEIANIALGACQKVLETIEGFTAWLDSITGGEAQTQDEIQLQRLYDQRDLIQVGGGDVSYLNQQIAELETRLGLLSTVPMDELNEATQAFNQATIENSEDLEGVAENLEALEWQAQLSYTNASDYATDFGLTIASNNDALKETIALMGEMGDDWWNAGKPSSHRVGLNYVPYDNYLAQLHKGEMVLTANEARAYKNQAVMSTNNNQQYLTVNNYSPKALNEAESARQYRRAQRQLALGF